MSVSQETPITSAVANGVTTVFPYSFTVLQSGDLKAQGELAGVVSLYTLGVDYALSGVGSGGGSVNFLAPPPNGSIITIYRDSELKRSNDYQANGDLLAGTLNGDIDRLWLALQEAITGGKALPSALRLPVGEVANPLPSAGSRLDKLVAFNPATGAPQLTSFTATQIASVIAAIYAASAGPLDALTFLQAGANAIARSPQAKMREPSVSVTDYAGCDPTGATASDAAFISALTHVASLARVAPGGVSTNRLGNKTIKIPAGVYLLTQSAALLNSALFTARTQGVTFEGDGPNGSVVLIYSPGISGPLMNNNDRALFVRFKNIIFHGQDANSDLLDSASTGGTQDYVFEDCSFTGTWKYGLNLTGVNVNSEMKFDRCMFAGSWLAFLFTAAAGTSDQFLNYWFSHCKYWCSSPWIDMAKGGSIKITDSDVSGYSPGAPTFLFNLRGNNHSRGVTSFSCKGVRFEQKTASAGVIYSEWEQGNIAFTECDFGSQAFQGFAAGVLSAHFSPGGTAGAMVKFDNCAIMGQHKFTAGNGPVGQGRLSYENCEFLNFPYPDDALILANTGQIGRQPTVRMRNCRGNSTDGVFADAEIGWHLTDSGTATRKLISLRGVFGGLPSAADGTQTVVLPLNAIITRAIIDVPAGATPSSASGAGYSLQTSDGTPLASLFMSPFSIGGNVDNPTFVRCTTRAKAMIQLIPSASNNTAAGGGSIALIEYIG